MKEGHSRAIVPLPAILLHPEHIKLEALKTRQLNIAVLLYLAALKKGKSVVSDEELSAAGVLLVPAQDGATSACASSPAVCSVALYMAGRMLVRLLGAACRTRCVG
jgi:hypothetical protein